MIAVIKGRDADLIVAAGQVCLDAPKLSQVKPACLQAGICVDWIFTV